MNNQQINNQQIRTQTYVEPQRTPFRQCRERSDSTTKAKSNTLMARKEGVRPPPKDIHL